MSELRPRVLRELRVQDPDGPDWIAAASGLVRHGDRLYVIADDGEDLAMFALGTEEPGRLVPLGAGSLPDDPKERKRRKPDWEALARLPDDLLVAFGSGSSPERHRAAVIALEAQGEPGDEPRLIDLAPLHDALRTEIPDLNLEGATVAGDSLVLLQRGNGPAAFSAVVELDLEAVRAGVANGTVGAAAVRSVRRMDLGEAGGWPLAFSDASPLADGRIVFTAVAERVASSYEDGPCAGSGVGVLDPGRGTIDEWRALAEPWKVEGVHVEEAGGRLDLLLTTDADDPATPAVLLAAGL